MALRDVLMIQTTTVLLCTSVSIIFCILWLCIPYVQRYRPTKLCDGDHMANFFVIFLRHVF